MLNCSMCSSNKNKREANGNSTESPFIGIHLLMDRSFVGVNHQRLSMVNAWVVY